MSRLHINPKTHLRIITTGAILFLLLLTLALIQGSVNGAAGWGVLILIISIPAYALLLLGVIILTAVIEQVLHHRRNKIS